MSADTTPAAPLSTADHTPGGTAAERIERLLRGLDAPGEAPPPPSVPGYELLGELGRGGMGVVYLARQTDLGRTVAVKTISAGAVASAGELARFVTEAEAVARVAHPNVVQVHHAGRAGGRPFYVMEYAPGGSLADRLRAGPLPPRDAATVAAAVARGVAACHAAGVLHRDLKPGNVLLSGMGDGGSGLAPTRPSDATPGPRPYPTPDTPYPVPKVTDFGLAKRLDVSDGPTATGAVLGTPSYMAPEQARGGEATPATDVYGLAAVLYAAVTGRPPFQAPTAVETLRQVTDTDPVGVRVLQPGTPRDLETVCLKGLAKEPGQRYPTAAAFADDLERWLAGEPVVARPAGPVERAAKWVRRNRVQTVAAAAVFVALAAGTGVSLWQAGVARTEASNARVAENDATEKRAAAEAARATAAEANGFLRDVLAQSNVYTAKAATTIRPNRTVREALDVAAGRLDGRYADRPDLELELRHTIGLSYLQLTAYDAAEPHLVRAAELARRLHPESAAVDIDLALLHQRRRRYAAAEPLLLAARGAADPAAAARAGYALAVLYQEWGKNFGRVEGLLDEAVGELERAGDPLDPYLFAALAARGSQHLSRQRHAEAEADLARAHAGRAAVHGPDHPYAVDTGAHLAVLYVHRGRPADAVPLFERALAARRAALGDRHYLTVVSRRQLAAALAAAGRPADAEPHADAALAEARGAIGNDHFLYLELLAEVAHLYVSLGRYAKAEPVLRELIERFEQIGHGGVSQLRQRGKLGLVVLRLGRTADAVPVLAAAYAELAALPIDAERLPASDTGPQLRETAGWLAEAHDRLGDAAAPARWRAAAAGHRELAPPPRGG